MSAPYPGAQPVRVEGPPRRPFPWWLLPVTVGMLGALALLWRVTEPPPAAPLIAAPVQPAPVIALDLAPVETGVAAALATATPWPTATVTPTPTPYTTLADTYGYCRADSPAGTVCVPNRPRVSTPTAIPTCFPSTQAVLCRVPGDPDLTNGKAETE